MRRVVHNVELQRQRAGSHAVEGDLEVSEKATEGAGGGNVQDPWWGE